MRFFGGMKNNEIAEALEISERTVGREWQSAKLWLFRELNRRHLGKKIKIEKFGTDFFFYFTHFVNKN